MKIETIRKIGKKDASEFVAAHHYRKTMPKLNRFYYGGFFGDRLVAIITFGFGTQPMATIKTMFPSLGTKDYLEVGRLCLIDELPRNSESNFMSRVFQELEKDSDIKVIFSWSDGIMGKPGFVYQAANFLYAGKIKTDVYITREGYLIHPRSAKKVLEANAFFERKSKLCWLTDRFCNVNGITHLKGFQFRYVYLLGSKGEKKRLMRDAIVPLNKEYPKTGDVFFFKKNELGKYATCEFPKYVETLSAEEVSRAIRVDSIDEGLVRFQHSAPLVQSRIDM
jgi:GR25 family glycosyltransferase involved in LPS biosynthesis